jgi:hypothetical protein
MTLYGQDAFNFYMEGAKLNSYYRVFPMNVSQLAHGLENIYTYRHRSDISPLSEDLGFAIGKVKET